MAQKGVHLDKETFSCPVCLDLLKDPVTIPCGHSYCMNCIKRFWDNEDVKSIYSCPQCRQSFTPRPVLMKNTMLADLVEELKKTGSADVVCYAGAEDVACDICPGRKRKASKSCLVCLASYCENHLQAHSEVPALSKHKLANPCRNLQENVCSNHSEVMKMFCRTDQQCICYLCSVDEHRGHDTVLAAAERTEKHRELEGSRQRIQQRILDCEKDVKLLQQEVEAISVSADKAVEDSEKSFAELILIMETRRSEIKQEIVSQQETEASRVKELQEKLEKEITELKGKDAELEQLSRIEDHIRFLHSSSTMSQLSEPTDTSSINVRPLKYFEGVTAAVSKLRDQLEDNLREIWTNISLTLAEVDVLLSQPKIISRAELFQHSREITLDPNTAHVRLFLSEGNRKATLMDRPHPYCRHPDRFTDYCQVLSRESLSGRCYWEVEWTGGGGYLAVSYKDITRSGRGHQCRFGHNDKSWALDCYQNTCQFWFDGKPSPISGPQASRVGVFLDHSAGLLSFYSVAETMTLLHRFHTTFTQPLLVGLRLPFNGGSAELCRLI